MSGMACHVVRGRIPPCMLVEIDAATAGALGDIQQPIGAQDGKQIAGTPIQTPEQHAVGFAGSHGVPIGRQVGGVLVLHGSGRCLFLGG